MPCLHKPTLSRRSVALLVVVVVTVVVVCQECVLSGGGQRRRRQRRSLEPGGATRDTRPSGGEEQRDGYYVIHQDEESRLEYYNQTEDLALRLIVLTMNRAQSLNECLCSLNAAHYLGDKVHLDIWVDRVPGGEGGGRGRLDGPTLTVAHHFTFLHGGKTVHERTSSVGVQAQWLSVWRPGQQSPPVVGLILEDDMTVSPLFWRWLKPAHAAYRQRPDLSGISLSHPDMEHASGGPLEPPPHLNNYLYRVVCTWGFSPHPQHWALFQDWVRSVQQDEPGFDPLVPGILPTQWYLAEKTKHRQHDLWEMWHIYYTHAHNQSTLMLNSRPGCGGLMAVNRHEAGLHDGALVRGATDHICSQWSDSFVHFPEKLPTFDYSGRLVGYD